MQLSHDERNAPFNSAPLVAGAGIGRKTVAVVAMQGDYAKHIEALERIGLNAIAARTAADIDRSDAVILPGGESTTIGKLLARYGVDDAIRRAAADGKAVYGTCAGLILIAREIAAGTGERGGQPTLGLLDIVVARNGYGRQIESFEASLDIPAIQPGLLPAVFIRAPIIVDTGPAVEVLANYDGNAVFVRQGNILGSAFHPELTGDDSVHRFFASLIAE
jgi:5'-phosphate synthase pdxT subunit